MNRCYLRCLLVSFLMFSAAGCKKPAPDHYVYSISVDSSKDSERKMFTGAVLYRGDTPLGTMMIHHVGTLPMVVASVPSAEWLSGSRLTFRFPTPCGPGTPIEVKLKLEREGEVDARKYFGNDCSEFSNCPERPITAFVSVGSVAIPKETKIWVDLGGKSRKVAIGKLEKRLDTKGLPLVVHGLDCSPKHTVKVDGKTIGEIKPDTQVVRVKRVLISPPATGPENFFVSTLPDACYRWRLVAYMKKGEFGGAPKPVVFGPVSVVRLEDAPNYFLEKAPSTVQVRSDEAAFGAFGYELVWAPCGNR